MISSSSTPCSGAVTEGLSTNLDGASSGGLASGNSFDGSWMASSMVFATTTAAVREARGVRDNRRGRERLQGEEHELSATVRFGSALAPGWALACATRLRIPMLHFPFLRN